MTGIKAWMKFWPGDWVSSTRDLTYEQQGVFIALLCWAWDHGGIPEDEVPQARILGMDVDAFRLIWTDALARRWEWDEDRPGFIVNPRQEREREAANKREERGRKGGEAAASKRQARTKRKPSTNQAPPEQVLDECANGRGQGQGQGQDSEAIPQQQHHGTQESPARFLALALCKSGLPLTELDGAEQILAGDRWLGGHGRLACTNRLQQIIAASQGASDQGACIVSLLEHDSAAHTGPIRVGGK